MSTATNERTDLDVDLDAEVPCDGLRRFTAHGADGEPAAARFRVRCHCGSRSPWLMLGTLCLDVIAMLAAMVPPACPKCGCEAGMEDILIEPL